MDIKKTTVKVISAVVTLSMILTTACYAVTVDDVREMLGRRRITDPTLEEDYEKVARLYILNELNNFGALLQSDVVVDEAAIAEQEATNIALKAESESLNSKLISDFTSNKPVSEIMTTRTKLEGVLSQIKETHSRGYRLEIEYIPNKWEQTYIELLATIKAQPDDYDIGQVGSGLRSPVEGYFKLLEPYGSVKKINNSKEIDLNTGIMWAAPSGVNILSQWNGVITAIYNSEIHGLSIEIAHGSGIVTTYGNLKSVSVEEGQEVKQYEPMGIANGNLWFTLTVDGLPANPLLLFGNGGLSAYKTWLNENPSRVVSSNDLDNILTSAPIDEPEHGYTIPIDKPDPTLNPGAQGFGENDIITSVPDGYTRPKPDLQLDLGN